MAAGINPRAWKLRAIALSAALTAMAGGLYAVVLLIVTPPSGVRHARLRAGADRHAVRRHRARVAGPVLGALILVPLGETLHAELGNRLPGIQGVVYGAAIIAVVLIAPEGILPRLAARWRRQGAAEAAAPLALDARAVRASGGACRLRSRRRRCSRSRGVSVRFGGLQALQDVAFAVRAGEILGIIGPNGAGKTTLFNALNGFISAASGSVKFEGKELAGQPPFAVCRAGIGRTFQIVRPFARLSVLHNVVVGAFPVERDDAQAYARAREAIRRVWACTGARPTHRIRRSPTVELRLMELARALAARPRLLLLDEILAGPRHDARSSTC